MFSVIEFMQMRIRPTHGSLQNPVQIIEIGISINQNGSPYWWIGVHKGNLQLINFMAHDLAADECYYKDVRKWLTVQDSCSWVILRENNTCLNYQVDCFVFLY